ncbi:MAG: hypothetical protein ACLPIC_06175 [Rhodoblastus sp.]|uniref:hypothetical protein n=1 Tax=Rhodoblastus sp. TaxID=1962975 RepID=UPI003F9AB75D
MRLLGDAVARIRKSRDEETGRAKKADAAPPLLGVKQRGIDNAPIRSGSIPEPNASDIMLSPVFPAEAARTKREHISAFVKRRITLSLSGFLLLDRGAFLVKAPRAQRGG